MFGAKRKSNGIFTVILLIGFVQQMVAQEEIDFARDIQPILSENCYFCHGQDENDRQAGLRLDTEEDALTTIEPGDAEGSDLFDRIISDDKDYVMPPPDSHRTITPSQKELIKRWINTGAKWKDHWAFTPIARPNVDAENAIDYFIQKKLAGSDLRPSKQADRATLIRRVSLDLTGLPPTPEQVTAFQNDQSPDAYSRMVDSFLSSPAFGERMAWDWLDAARYADTNGYQGDNERTMWPWRDWVVEAFNRNMPFDQFSTWQLAGDLLPNATHEQILATGFNRNHPINGEGGRIAEENRVDYVMDMAETTGTVWLGLTFNCCRCHDHKYDKLSQEDYYSLFAFFNQTPINGGGGNAQTPPILEVPNPSQQKQLEQFATDLKEWGRQLTARREFVTKELAEFEIRLNQKIKSTAWSALKPTRFVCEKSEIKQLEDGSLLTFGPNPDNDNYQVQGTTELDQVSALLLEALPHDSMTAKGLARSNSGNFVLTEINLFHRADATASFAPVKITKAEASFEQSGLPVTSAFDGNPKTGWAVYQGKPITNAHQAVFVFETPVTTTNESEFKITLNHESIHKHHNLGRFRLSLTHENSPRLNPFPPQLISGLAKTKEERSAVEDKAILDAALELDESWTALTQKKNQTESAIARIKGQAPKVMVMKDRPEHRQTFLLNRGSYQEPEQEVSARVPLSLPSLPDGAPVNRLALANWLFAPENPLTARVTVNRLWAQIFGIGLVKTTEDFGVQGEPPSHPLLLDWLASEYRESGWNTKHMLRLILNSATYKQSSVATRLALELDPENRLLSRSPRYRMPSWMIRDNALAVSQTLVRDLGGPPINAYQPPGVWEEASFGKKKYRQGEGKDLYRRSIYVFWRRIAPPTMFFDNADRLTCSVNLRKTNTPLHALQTLNDTTFVEAARRMAEKIVSQHQTSEERIEVVFQHVLSRLPSEAEKKILIKAVERATRQYAADNTLADELLRIGDTPHDPNLDKVELASWASLCLIVINMDEAITRQ